MNDSALLTAAPQQHTRPPGELHELKQIWATPRGRKSRKSLKTVC
jgi:hypothetical protein